jgi:hypothetical protein
MTSDLPVALRELARIQHGVFSRRQAIRAGLTVDLIGSRVRRQAWLSLYPGVYTILTGTPGRNARLWAAVLYSGAGALLSHETAAELHGLADASSNPIYVTVPAQRKVVSAEGISIYRSARALEAVQGRSYPPRTRIEETVLDLTQAAATFDDVCGWVTRAFARDLTDEARLRKAMSIRPKLRWRGDLDELIAAAADGDHSVLEYRYDRDVERAHGLPTARRQVPFTGPGGRRGRRDLVYEDYALAVELDGRLAHPADSQWKDRARDNAATVGGMQTLRYGWVQVRQAPCDIATEVATVLRMQGWPGRPRACSVGCRAPRAFP